MISYTANQRRYANHNNMDLITIEVPGMSFQGPVPKEESQMLNDYLLALWKRLDEALKSVKPEHS